MKIPPINTMSSFGKCLPVIQDYMTSKYAKTCKNKKKTPAQSLRDIHFFLLLLCYISPRERAARLDAKREGMQHQHFYCLYVCAFVHLCACMNTFDSFPDDFPHVNFNLHLNLLLDVDT